MCWLLLSPLQPTSTSQAPRTSLGKQAKMVLTTAMTLQSESRIQFMYLSTPLISLENSLRWKASGRMMQMVKQATEPMMLIILSKSGTKTARPTNVATVKTRIPKIKRPRLKSDMWAPFECAAEWASTPHRMSMVLMIGRALQLLSVISQTNKCLPRPRYWFNSLQGDLGQRYHSDANDDKNRDDSWVARSPEYVHGHLIAYAVSEHEQTHYSDKEVQRILRTSTTVLILRSRSAYSERICYIHASSKLLGMSHIFVDAGTDRRKIRTVRSASVFGV